MKQTSLEAFEKIKPKRPNHHKLILEVFNELTTATYREIAIESGLEHHAVARRLPELVRQGKLVECGKRRCQLAKSSCTVYKLKPTDGND